MDTDAVAVLVSAAAAGSLSAAARRLGITPMVATRRLAALERDLGVRLLQRTTRSLSLTPEGEAFLPFAETLVEGEAAGRAVLRAAAKGAAGLLRVTVPAAFGRKMVAPIVPGLLRANPELRLDLHLSDHLVDVVSAGFDLAIRVSKLKDSSLIARRLAGHPRVLCASPAYLAERGVPQRLEDLERHDCLASSGVTHWVFRCAGQVRRARVGGRYSSNSIDGLYEACVGGVGIGLLADWNVRADCDAGRLIRLALADATPEEWSTWAVFPTSRQVLPKVRVFLAALEAALARPDSRLA
jgi:DNA-binding transcriptional LysR family regulator